jgi:CheY-like chemotaxis protein
MKLLVEGYGYRVIEANDGIEAVDSFKKQHPDLILMDIAMPCMDGLTATRLIRESEDGAELPIIAITAHGQSYYIRAIEAGCTGLINKPVDLDILEPILNQYLGR